MLFTAFSFNSNLIQNLSNPIQYILFQIFQFKFPLQFRNLIGIKLINSNSVLTDPCPIHKVGATSEKVRIHCTVPYAVNLSWVEYKIVNKFYSVIKSNVGSDESTFNIMRCILIVLWTILYVNDNFFWKRQCAFKYCCKVISGLFQFLPQSWDDDRSHRAPHNLLVCHDCLLYRLVSPLSLSLSRQSYVSPSCHCLRHYPIIVICVTILSLSLCHYPVIVLCVTILWVTILL